MSSSSRYRRPATAASAADNTPSSPASPAQPSSPTSKQADPLAKEKAELKEAVHEQAVKTSNSLSVLDVLRIAGGIVLLVCGLSYLSTSGESMTWGYNGKWTRAREWKGIFVCFPSLSHIFSLFSCTGETASDLSNSYFAVAILDISANNQLQQIERNHLPNRHPTHRLRRHRPHKTNLPRPQRHNLRRLLLPHHLRPRRKLPLLRRPRRRPRLPNRLFRRRRRPRSTRRRNNVHARRPGDQGLCNRRSKRESETKKRTNQR